MVLVLVRWLVLGVLRLLGLVAKGDGEMMTLVLVLVMVLVLVLVSVSGSLSVWVSVWVLVLLLVVALVSVLVGGQDDGIASMNMRL